MRCWSIPAGLMTNYHPAWTGTNAHPWNRISLLSITSLHIANHLLSILIAQAQPEPRETWGFEVKPADLNRRNLLDYATNKISVRSILRLRHLYRVAVNYRSLRLWSLGRARDAFACAINAGHGGSGEPRHLHDAGEPHLRYLFRHVESVSQGQQTKYWRRRQHLQRRRN